METTQAVPAVKAIKPFVPQAPVIFYGGNPATKLSSREKASLLAVFNATRTGLKSFVVEAMYQKQTDAAPRIAPVDYQAPTGISPKLHFGTVINAKLTQEGKWIITLADSLRNDKGEQGYTSLRLEGLKTFKVIASSPGPLSKDRIIDII